MIDPTIERNLGEQPIAKIIRELGLSHHDLVAAAPRQITHKMVTRACKGRRLTVRSKQKVVAALCAAAKTEFATKDLFNY